MYKKDLSLGNLQYLIYHKTEHNQTKLIYLSINRNQVVHIAQIPSTFTLALSLSLSHSLSLSLSLSDTRFVPIGHHSHPVSAQMRWMNFFTRRLTLVYPSLGANKRKSLKSSLVLSLPGSSWVVFKMRRGNSLTADVLQGLFKAACRILVSFSLCLISGQLVIVQVLQPNSSTDLFTV